MIDKFPKYGMINPEVKSVLGGEAPSRLAETGRIFSS